MPYGTSKSEIFPKSARMALLALFKVNFDGTSKPKILEITLLIADYMNMMGQHLPLSQKATNLSRGSSRAASKSRLNVSNTGAIKSAPNTPRLHSKEETSILRHGSNAGSLENSYHKGQKLSQESPIA